MIARRTAQADAEDLTPSGGSSDDPVAGPILTRWRMHASIASPRPMMDGRTVVFVSRRFASVRRPDGIWSSTRAGLLSSGPRTVRPR